MEVSILRSLHATKVQTTTLEKIVRITQTSFILKSLTERARKHYKAGSKGKGDRIKKLLLPAFAPAGYLLDGKGLHIIVPYTLLRDDSFTPLPHDPKALNKIYW